MRMKISLYVPAGSDRRNFIREEIAQAQNIKSKATKKAVVTGLKKILQILQRRQDGIAIFTDGDEIFVEDYDGIKKLYHCGQEYKRIERKVVDPYLLVVIDANNSAIGTSDGERVTVLWHDRSLVPRKHKAGGQSQRRFERDRNRAFMEWIRMVVEKLRAFHKNQKIIVGGCGMTKDIFVKEMTREMRDSVIDIRSVGYTDENGLWELMRISRYEKVNS